MRGRYTLVELPPYRWAYPRSITTDALSFSGGLFSYRGDTNLKRTAEWGHFLLVTPLSARLMPEDARWAAT